MIDKYFLTNLTIVSKDVPRLFVKLTLYLIRGQILIVEDYVFNVREEKNSFRKRIMVNRKKFILTQERKAFLSLLQKAI